ncbi:FHA domain-containing protein [Tessaracoccus sp. ZS01]|uniref:FHA domain-containing protein n=1 Tax=Tessaracoccus sp. ZS01 TaxID=1906324 RepID=UPI00096CD2D8|nr:FHA domain-containing protein [Tessaracoccus sp. ZS01]MCG6568770.1 hypothetical protein [Tessaracoccus sp. ZS01]OMG51740.1 hypothetical protein BJN44_14225 [Tessaracoccus sp. ZS01]
MTRPMAAWRTTYTPGAWLALTGPSTLVVMAPPPSRAAATVNELWLSVVAAGSLDALLTLVSQVGLDSMPDLGAFHWDDDGLHGLARGRVRVVDTDSGDVVLQGEGSVTWREEHLGRERNLGITLEEFDADQALQLPLVVGAATVSAVFLTTDPAALVRFPTADEPAGTPQFVPTAAHVSDDDAPVDVVHDEFSEAMVLDAPPSEEFNADDTDEAGPEEIAAALSAVIPPPVAPEVVVPPIAEPASLSSPAERPAPVVVPRSFGEVEEDDGGTIFSTGLAATHKPAPPADERPDPQVLAVPCVNNHPNAPGSRTCRICQYPVDSSNPRLIRRPVLAGVHTNRGDFADIVAGIVVGRAPDSGHGPSGSHLMRVASPSNDISRNHLLITTQDWNVHVTDLDSTNGTTVLPAGEPPFTLRDGASVQVGIGTVLDLGDGVSLRIEPPRG